MALSATNLSLQLPRLRGHSMPSLMSALKDAKERERFVVAPDGKLRMETIDSPVLSDEGVGDSERINVFRCPDPDGGPDLILRPTTIGHDQIANATLAERRYYRKCGEQFPDLLAVNVNAWMQTNKEKGRFLRLWRQDDGSFALRAFLTERYRILNNFDLAAHAVQGCQNAAARQDLPLPILHSWEINERTFDMTMIYPEVTVDVNALEAEGGEGRVSQVRRHSGGVARAVREAWDDETTRARVQPFGPRGLDAHGGGGLAMAACRIRNSETGFGRMRVELFGLFADCWNGWHTGHEIANVHLGEKLTQEAVLSERTMMERNKVIYASVQDAVEKGFTGGGLLEICRAVNALKLVRVTEVTEAVDAVVESGHLTQAARESILLNYEQQMTDPTAFDVYQGITAAVRETRPVNYQLADDMEKVAVRLVTKTSSTLRKAAVRA